MNMFGLSRASTPLTLALGLSFGAMTAAAQDTTQPATTTYIVSYTVEKVPFEGRYVVPNPTPSNLPLIVLYPDWMGVSDRAKIDAERFAAQGYAVFIVDPYGKTARPDDAGQAAVLSGALKKDVVKLRRIAAGGLKTAMNQHSVDTNRVAALGFCFGGTTALELARTGVPLKGVAVVHGNLATPFPDDARAIRSRVLVLHGGADPHVPPSELETFRNDMNRAGANYTVIEYPGAMHSFTNPDARDRDGGAAYDRTAAESAFGELDRFFADVLDHHPENSRK